ncbi:hypothetical protein ACFLSJ_09085, partial [Verrucomicrobiota bacterium]
MAAPWRQPSRWFLFLGSCAAVCVVFSLLPTSRPEALGDRVVGHWTSVLPPFLAVITAICFRTLVWALLAAFVLGSFLAYWPQLLLAVPMGIKSFVWVNFTEQFNLYIFAFLFALVGM